MGNTPRGARAHGLFRNLTHYRHPCPNSRKLTYLFTMKQLFTLILPRYYTQKVQNYGATERTPIGAIPVQFNDKELSFTLKLTSFSLNTERFPFYLRILLSLTLKLTTFPLYLLKDKGWLLTLKIKTFTFNKWRFWFYLRIRNCL